MNITSLKLFLWHARIGIASQMHRGHHSRPAVLLREIRRARGRDGLRWYIQRLIHNAGKCELCFERTALVFDHDHSTGNLRGLICAPCNGALTDKWDSASWRERAIIYLDAPQASVKYAPMGPKMAKTTANLTSPRIN